MQVDEYGHLVFAFRQFFMEIVGKCIKSHTFILMRSKSLPILLSLLDNLWRHFTKAPIRLKIVCVLLISVHIGLNLDQ